MRFRMSRRILAAGAVATSIATLLGPGMAHAATLGTAPQFFTPGVNQFRATGSETSYYVMNAVGNLYSQSSIFGCTLDSTNWRTCVTTGDGSATDTLDNYSRNEFINGEGVGTGNGIKQLCGTVPTGGLTVDFARGSRAPTANDNCPNAVGLEFARDSVVGLDFPFHNTTTIACAAGMTCTAQQIGPVAAGWRPGDPLAGPYSGNAFSNIDGQGNSNFGGNSLAYEMYCDKTGAFAINDWGQLTDKTKPVGLGTPIGVPIYFPAVNSGSGTYSTWKGFVGCDPNTKNTDGKVVQENDAPQLSDIAAADNPTDNIAAANQVAASLYYVSFGVSQWHKYTTTSSNIAGKLTKINNVTASPSAETGKTIVTWRGLFNIYRSDALRASVAGFLNWVCDTDASNVNHGVDLTTGKNYNAELTNTISTQFVFPRVACSAGGPPISAGQITDMNS